MKDIPVADVRNFALLGHTGCGKTTLVDAILLKLGVTDRPGSTADGSSFADWTDEEKERNISVWAKPFDGVYTSKAGRKTELVMIDTPGYADFYGQVVAAAAVADSALIVVDASSGIQVGTNRAWRHCQAKGLPRAIVITGLDKENAKFKTTLDALQRVWGSRCVPAVVPTADLNTFVDVLGADHVPEELKEQVDALKLSLVEAAAETDDSLIEKYLEGEALSADEIAKGLHGAVANGTLIPVFAVATLSGKGLDELLDGFCRLFPSPIDRDVKNAQGESIDVSASAPFSGLVWRSITDPYVGQLTFLRVFSGTLKGDSEVLNATTGEKERIAALYFVNGKSQEVAPEAEAGDIVAIAKLKHTTVNHSLCAIGQNIQFSPIEFPNPVASYSVTSKAQGDEDKLAVGLQKIAEEDPTLRLERNTETHEQIISGLGDIQLDIAVKRLKANNNVDVLLDTPKVAYKETVTATGEGHYKHKKQSGGRGQYGEVYLRVEKKAPDEDDWFVNKIVGGAIPSGFIPAVQKGLVDGMLAGAVAGYPVVEAKVTIYDGSYHDVDSSEIAFKIAGARAFREGMSKAKPVLLEPIMNVKVVVPEQFMGDVTGDLTHKRGRILGMDSEDGMQVMNAEVPRAELFKYSSELRSITGGQGSFDMEFSRYEVVPANIAQKVVTETQKHKQEED